MNSGDTKNGAAYLFDIQLVFDIFQFQSMDMPGIQMVLPPKKDAKLTALLSDFSMVCTLQKSILTYWK